MVVFLFLIINFQLKEDLLDCPTRRQVSLELLSGPVLETMMVSLSNYSLPEAQA